MAEEEKATSEPAPSEVFKMAHQPKKPVMGGLTQTDDDKWMAWTSRKPKVDWSSFLYVTHGDFRTPNQMRPLYDVTMLKAFLVAGGTDKEDLHWSLRGMDGKLDDELLGHRLYG